MLTKEKMDLLPGLVAEATPGPWMVFTPDDYEGPEQLPGLGVEAENGDAVVWYCDQPETGITKDANAHLISLAPSLAATVIEQQAEIERMRSQIHQALGFYQVTHIRAALYAALTPDRAATNALGNIAHAVKDHEQ